VRLVLLGSPGAGKGTQGALLAEHFSIPRVATGDIFREALASDSELGRQARAYVERGELVPDSVTVGIVRQRLSQPDCAQGFVLDGFPRTVAQAVALDELLEELGCPLQAAIYLDVPVEVAVERAARRRVCADCGQVFTVDDARATQGRCPACGGALVQREDDREETVRRRLEVYRQATAPVIDYYRERKLLLTIDGRHAIDEVFQAICRGLTEAGLLDGASRRSRLVGADGA